jgi:hypothetical protein
MPSTQQRSVPINACRHKVHRFPGACDVIEVESDGLPVDVPSQITHPAPIAFLRGLEVSLVFAAGVAAGMLLLG